MLAIDWMLGRSTKISRNSSLTPLPSPTNHHENDPFAVKSGHKSGGWLETMPHSTHFHLLLPIDTQTANSGAKESVPHSKSVSSLTGTFPFLHPTHAHIHADSERLDWNSRDHRKGRHPVRTGERRHINTFLRLEYWNISWWVAILFTLGSVVWVINGFIVFLPSLYETEPNNAAGGWTAWVGGSLFELGAYMMILEALNRKHEVCFGDAAHQAWSSCSHNFHNRSPRKSTDTETSSVQKEAKQKWRWFGARWGEIGFIASFIQFMAATTFWISTYTGIPGVLDMNNTGLVDGLYWTPQVIGGSGFIIASLLFMWETQPAWYHIRPFDSLGWHVGFWNLMGALGFTLCGAFGYPQAQYWAEYQSSLSTFWGGWAFLIGSIAQWVEALNR